MTGHSKEMCPSKGELHLHLWLDGASREELSMDISFSIPLDHDLVNHFVGKLTVHIPLLLKLIYNEYILSSLVMFAVIDSPPPVFGTLDSPMPLFPPSASVPDCEDEIVASCPLRFKFC